MADHKEELKARVFLRSALPLVKVVLSERPNYRYLLYKADGVINLAPRTASRQLGWQ